MSALCECGHEASEHTRYTGVAHYGIDQCVRTSEDVELAALRAEHAKALEAVRVSREALIRFVRMVRGDPGEGGVEAVAEMVNAALSASAEVVK